MSPFEMSMFYFREMDKRGDDANITSSSFSTHAYGPELKASSTMSTAENLRNAQQSTAVLSLPTDPNKVFYVDVANERMIIMYGWTLSNARKEIEIKNFYEQDLALADLGSQASMPPGFVSAAQAAEQERRIQHLITEVE